MLIPVEQNAMTSGRYKYLVHTPTMRVPKDVSNTDNAYLAFRALLTEIFNHNRQQNDIKTVAMTSFYCGAGKMSPSQAAKQMRLAYDCVVGNTPCTWEMANKIENMLNNIN